MVPQLEGPHVNCTTRCNSSAPAPTDAVRRAATPQHYKPLKNRNCDFSISASQVPSLTHGQRRPSRADWQHGTRSWLLTCSHAPVLGGGEHVPLGDDDGCDAENTDNDQVDEARLRVTVEGVIKPRNKTSHNQKSNTGVIQSRIGKKIHLLLNITAPYRFQSRVPGRQYQGFCQLCWMLSLSPRAWDH